jgi:DNA helicase-2/ATP-dependent DNA helicase PcrA
MPKINKTKKPAQHKPGDKGYKKNRYRDDGLCWCGPCQQSRGEGGYAGDKQEDKQRPDPCSAAAEKSAQTAAPAGVDRPLFRPRPVDNAPHVIVEARAGTGKTTTLVEGLKLLKGIPSPLTPSPQQRAVWDSICQSPKESSVCFVAFNKSIATELKNRVPAGCEAMTMHSLGLLAVRNAFPKVKVEQCRTQNIIAELRNKDIWQLRKEEPVLLKATEELVGLCKMNLIDPVGQDQLQDTGLRGFHTGAEALERLCAHYDVECNGSREQVFDLVPQVLERCKEVAKDGCVDFDDMIWLPIVLDLPVKQHDLLLVDEAQDLNRCQQALAKRAGRRLILCGDPKQAIYGFAGADSESMNRMKRELSEDGCKDSKVFAPSRGCIVLPLTVTRRCGKAIVKEANRWVPEFEAHESNPEGKVGRADYEKGTLIADNTYHQSVTDGDFILCRTNAPLISQCFRFLKAGRKANIQGRNVGQGLISTVKKSKAGTIPEFISWLDAWLHSEQAKENAKRSPSEARLTALQDRRDCLICFAESVETVAELTAKIESVFTDDKDKPGIRLSSIHKAKGLESRRVFFLMPPGTGPREDKMQAWELEQEANLRYVAVTRAIEELIYVS